MPKLVKQKYRSVATGEIRVNCYTVNIPKKVVQEAFKNDDESNLRIYAEGDKIVIEIAE